MIHPVLYKVSTKTSTIFVKLLIVFFFHIAHGFSTSFWRQIQNVSDVSIILSARAQNIPICSRRYRWYLRLPRHREPLQNESTKTSWIGRGSRILLQCSYNHR